MSDRLSKLPDDTLLSIMSRLTLKEAAQLGTLSLNWRELWTCFSGVFNFEDPRLMRDWRSSLLDQALVNQYISRFVSWVAQIVEQHRGSSIEEFKVAFALDNTCQSQIDKWVAFALAKRTKSLVLNFRDKFILSPTASFYAPSLECFLSLESPNL
ncbi:unnamed protein product [Cuscuta campestris]|uniref:F-box domain-containing protein n=1 Tax=Cuscuta campestris TaxID=132261 RepID=A0A484LJE3_9ASTE|nr:unnamed protein product [Cuscuta campestris]